MKIGDMDTVPVYYGHTPKIKERPDIVSVYHGQLLEIFGNK